MRLQSRGAAAWGNDKTEEALALFDDHKINSHVHGSIAQCLTILAVQLVLRSAKENLPNA